MNGQGTFTWADGRQYTGQYKNDKKEGQGLILFGDGTKYEGGWKDNLQEGAGKYTDEN